jgi:hypothetical protein
MTLDQVAVALAVLFVAALFSAVAYQKVYERAYWRGFEAASGIAKKWRNL